VNYVYILFLISRVHHIFYCCMSWVIVKFPINRYYNVCNVLVN